MISNRQMLVVRLKGILRTSKQDANVVSVIEASIEILVTVSKVCVDRIVPRPKPTWTYRIISNLHREMHLTLS